MTGELKPADGVAAVLHLIEAARTWRAGSFVTFNDSPDLVALAESIDALTGHLARASAPAPAATWREGVWAEVVEGDRVRIGGAEADVLGATRLDWHVDPRGSRYESRPLEHSTVAVILRAAGAPAYDWRRYEMPAAGPIEILPGRPSQAVAEAGVTVLESWAAGAAVTLRAAGLAPERVQ